MYYADLRKISQAAYTSRWQEVSYNEKNNATALGLNISTALASLPFSLNLQKAIPGQSEQLLGWGSVIISQIIYLFHIALNSIVSRGLVINMLHELDTSLPMRDKGVAF